jgi:DHA2 family multidrug resistance protein
LTNVLDPRLEIGIGLAMFALGSWWMGDLNQYAGYWDIFWPRTLQGFALGFLFVPLTTTALAEISRSAMGNATGIYTLVRQLGGSLGIALLLLIEERREDFAQQMLAANVTLSNPAVSNLLSSSHDTAQAVAKLSGMVVQNSTVIAYDYVFRLCGIIFALSIPMVFLLTKPKAAAGAEPALVE